jgi:hypothetical protein
MQTHSIIPLKKGDPFITGSNEVDKLLQVYWQQLNAMADAEMSGMPEPVFDVPPLPIFLITKIK